MGTTTSSVNQSYEEVLQLACNKKSPAEIEFEINEEEKQFGRMRLLKHGEGALYVDRPTYQGTLLELASGTAIVVHFIYDGERFAFHSRIEEECQIPLGSAQHVPGYALEIPDQVFRQERRTDYRVSLARFAEVSAYFQDLECAQESPCFVARLTNISAGGFAAVVIDMNGHGHEVQRGDIFQIDFDLPKVNRHFSFKAELRHLRTLDGAGYVMGLKYMPETNAAEMRHAIRQISQFVAKELKRKGKSNG